MKTQVHSSTHKQIAAQADMLKITLFNNGVENIDYTALARNKLNTNKGDFGTVGIIGGARGMHGSMYLAGRAAMSCGAGRVVLASLDDDFTFDLLMPELLTAKPKDVLKHLENYDVVIISLANRSKISCFLDIFKLFLPKSQG